MEDEKIIELFWQRDESAIRQTEQKYGGICRSIALRILEDSGSSEECLNDTWLRAWNAIPPQRPAVLKAFVCRITRNLALNRLRDLSREKRGGKSACVVLDELEGCLPDLSTPEKELEDQEITQSLNRWLDTLPKQQRVAFVRRYWYFDSLKDLSVRMGWSVSKTNSLLRRLRESLKKHLESEEIAL